MEKVLERLTAAHGVRVALLGVAGLAAVLCVFVVACGGPHSTVRVEDDEDDDNDTGQQVHNSDGEVCGPTASPLSIRSILATIMPIRACLMILYRKDIQLYTASVAVIYLAVLAVSSLCP